MSRTLILFCLLPCFTWGIERAKLDHMLIAAASNQGSAYLADRNAIINLGTNALPMLAQAGCDKTLIWQQRLLARICYERITRGNEILSLRENDWRSYPPYLPLDQQMALEASQTNASVNSKPTKKMNKPTFWTPAGEMRIYVMPKCVEFRLWYYYIELTWKKTYECAIFKQKPDKGFNSLWPKWCRETLKNQPEELYMLSVIFDRLQNDTTLADSENVEFYKEFLKNKEADAVPVLVERYDAYNKREVIGPELFAGRHAELYRGMFEKIFSFADSRHADLLEKFIDEHSALAELKPKLANVRARPAPEPKTDPPFRRGTNVVSVAQ